MRLVRQFLYRVPGSSLAREGIKKPGLYTLPSRGVLHLLHPGGGAALRSRTWRRWLVAFQLVPAHVIGFVLSVVYVGRWRGLRCGRHLKERERPVRLIN